MSSFSINTVWEDMTVFLRRESGIVLPLALATFGLAMVLTEVTTPAIEAMPGGGGDPTSSAVAAGTQLLWLIPAMLLVILGNLSISLTVLRPGISIGEALKSAVGRVPVAIGLIVLMTLFVFALVIVAGLVLAIFTIAGSGGPAVRQNIAFFLVVLPLGWMAIRSMLIWPLVGDGMMGPIDSIRRCFAISKGHFWRLLLTMLVFGSLYISLISISQLALTPVFRLLGAVTGEPEPMRLIGDLITAFIGAVLMMGWTVFLACAYRRLAEPEQP